VLLLLLLLNLRLLGIQQLRKHVNRTASAGLAGEGRIVGGVMRCSDAVRLG
jgi:hypothetical protein